MGVCAKCNGNMRECQGNVWEWTPGECRRMQGNAWGTYGRESKGNVGDLQGDAMGKYASG